MPERKGNIQVRVLALVAVLLVANAVLGYMLAGEAERAITEQIRYRMLDIACSAAELLDGGYLANVKAEDANEPEYQDALQTLAAFQDNVQIEFIYCLRESDDGVFRFTIDPSEDPADFGEEAALTDALKQASKGSPSVDLVAYEDRWGRFYSAYCPVFDSKGKVASVVGVDFDAGWYESHAFAINGMAITNTLASLVLAIIAIIMVARMSRAETTHMESLLRANNYDALTGLPNMSHFLETAGAFYDGTIEKGRSPAMLYIDIVGMKLYNQKKGYAEGDQLLKSFANLLRKHFGQERCSRFGQDHFAVSTYAEDLEARLDAFIEEYSHMVGSSNMPVSIGIHVESLDDKIGASAACDRAKTACESGSVPYKSTYTYFVDDMNDQAEQQQYIIDNIDRAIEKGWIQVYYQPIVRTSTGKVCDEEALARWIDPERGMISPAEFIPVLEDAKAIHKLDLCVLEQTLAKMKRVAAAGLHVVTGSINLSREDFETCDIVEEVRKRVDDAGIERSKINVEITETALGSDFDFMRKQIERFHDLGFKVWMDDFGSKYSSLDFLQNIRFDVLKLDMRFMKQFDNSNDKSKIILTELVKMALSLDIETVVEGVETQEQVDFLRRIGCSKLQGFYFTQPIPLEQVLKRYETGAAIGFENPAEVDYYSSVGRLNLYDLSSLTRSGEEGLEHYFDTPPMAVVECTDDAFTIMRCNRTYLDFLAKSIEDTRVGMKIPYAQTANEGANQFVQAIRECSETHEWLTIDEPLPDNATAHSFLRHIATNPVSGASAIAVAVLAVVEN